MEYDVPTQINSIGLHPKKSVFVCGGEDFKMYKYDYNTGMELGKICTFHCVNACVDLLVTAFYVIHYFLFCVFQNLSKDILVQFMLFVSPPMVNSMPVEAKMVHFGCGKQ